MEQATIIFYEYKDGTTGALIVDHLCAYVCARAMCPKTAKYKGMKRINKLDLRFGRRYYNEPNIE